MSESGDSQPNPILEDLEMVRDFVQEAGEHVASLNQELLAFEERPTDPELLFSLFRRFHTLKGVAGLLGLEPPRNLAHQVETLLSDAREGSLMIEAEAVDVLLAAVDSLREAFESALNAAESGDRPELKSQGPLLERLAAVRRGSSQEDAGEQHVEATATKSADSNKSKGDHGALRVDVRRLDELVEMAGELIVTETLVRHDASVVAGSAQSELPETLARLSRLAQDIHALSMNLRMVPLARLFARSARLVRDAARQSGKRIRFESSGAETEIDKTIVELLADPLLHLLRNAADHGAEPADERTAAGKAPEATIAVKASHEGGHVVVEVSDDGRGIDTEKVLEKAQRMNLVARGAALSREEIHGLVFAPGFTTASAVSDLSGRGVGLDVVKRHIEELRGTIQIDSPAGRGTTFRILIPITLAVIEGLIVSVAGQRFVVPLFAVTEMVRPSGDCLHTLEGANEMAMIHGELLPVVRLAQAFGLPDERDLSESVLIVSELGARRICLSVDEYLGKHEVVVKSLGPAYEGVRGLSGGAILSDGRVGLILDLDELGGGRPAPAWAGPAPEPRESPVATG